MKKLIMILTSCFLICNCVSSQIVSYQCNDTLLIKVVCYKAGKIRNQQLIKIFCSYSVSTVQTYDKYKAVLLPKEGLDKEKMRIAEMLINVKDTSHIPQEYKSYLIIPVNDNQSILRLSESYNSFKEVNKLKSATLNCLQHCNVWLLEKAKEKKRRNGKLRTKVEFLANGKSNIFFIDYYEKAESIFKCLFE